MRYWVAVLRPTGFEFPAEDRAAMASEIDALNAEMVEAGVRVFVGGLQPVAGAIRVRPGEPAVAGAQSGGGLVVDGFWVLEVADEVEAQGWAARAAVACRAEIELRRFY